MSYLDCMRYRKYNTIWFKTSYECRVREEILMKDWGIENTSFKEELNEIHSEAMNHPVMLSFISRECDGEYDETIKVSAEVKEGIKEYCKEFSGQFPTGKQVYYYMELCRELEIEPKRIETIYHMLKVTSKLRAELSTKKFIAKQKQKEIDLEEKSRIVESLVSTRKSLKISQNDIIDNSTLSGYLIRAIENPEKIKRVRSVADIDRYIAYTRKIIKERIDEGVESK